MCEVTRTIRPKMEETRVVLGRILLFGVPLPSWMAVIMYLGLDMLCFRFEAVVYKGIWQGQLKNQTRNNPLMSIGLRECTAYVMTPSFDEARVLVGVTYFSVLRMTFGALWPRHTSQVVHDVQVYELWKKVYATKVGEMTAFNAIQCASRWCS